MEVIMTGGLHLKKVESLRFGDGNIEKWSGFRCFFCERYFRTRKALEQHSITECHDGLSRYIQHVMYPFKNTPFFFQKQSLVEIGNDFLTTHTK